LDQRPDGKPGIRFNRGPGFFDRANGVVALTDDRFFTAGRFRTFSDEDIGRSRLLDPSAFRPLWFTLQERTVSLLKPNDTLQYTFAMAAQNQTGKPIEAGHEDLHAIYSFADDKSSASDFDGLPTPGYAGTPASGGCPR